MDWGDCAIEIVRLPGSPEAHGVSRDTPIRLVEVDQQGEETDLEPLEACQGRTIIEYLTNHNCWRTKAEAIADAEGGSPCSYPEIKPLAERPRWASDLYCDVYRAIANGEIALARLIKEQLEREIGAGDPEMSGIESLIRRRELMGK